MIMLMHFEVLSSFFVSPISYVLIAFSTSIMFFLTLEVHYEPFFQVEKIKIPSKWGVYTPQN